MEVLDMTSVGAMPEAAPAIHAKVLQSPRNSSNLAMQREKNKNKKRKESNVLSGDWGLFPIARSGACNSNLCYENI